MKKIFFGMVIIVIAVLATSCSRYNVESTVSESDFTTQSNWEKVFNDTISDMLRDYFELLGDDLSIQQADIVHRQHLKVVEQMKSVAIPDKIVDQMPILYDVYRNGEIMIGNREVHRISGPTWFKAPKVQFTLDVYHPTKFAVAHATIITRDAKIFWQLMMIMFFLVELVFMTVCLCEGINNIELRITGIVIAIGTVVMLGLMWYYLCIILSIIATLLFLLICGIIYKDIKQAKKEIDPID